MTIHQEDQSKRVDLRDYCMSWMMTRIRFQLDLNKSLKRKLDLNMNWRMRRIQMILKD